MNHKATVFLLFILLLCVSLSGCQQTQNGNNTTNDQNGNPTGDITGDDQQNTNGNPFLGSWQVTDTTASYESWTFYANHSAQDYLIQELDNETLTSVTWFEYIVDETTLCFTSNASPDSPEYFSICYTYGFSENATRLMFSHNAIVIMDLQKIFPE